jgi:hypothetical protein
VPRTKDLTLDEFAAYVEARPARLACWQDGAGGQYPMLAWLNARPIVEQRELASTVGPHAAVMMLAPQHHNQVGIAAGWVTRFMTGPTRRQSSSEQDRVAMFKTAGAYWFLRNSLVEVRVGVRAFQAAGRLVRLPYQGNHAVDALDRLLDLVESLDSVGKAPAFSSPRLRDWIYREGLSQPWAESPTWVRDAFREHARNVLGAYPRYLPEGATIAAVTLGDFDKFWVELLAWGMHMHVATMLGSYHLPTILPLLPRSDLVNTLARATGLSPSVVDRIVALLALDVARCSDGALTPLVPIDGQMVPMSSLIVPTSPQRNLLAIVQSEPSMVGEAGRLLGLAGERATLALLERLRGALVASRIKVLRPNGSPAGDLDVVACDPATRTAAIFEIKWGIAADGNAEVYRSEQGAIEKRAQVIRLREEIDAWRAVPQWPAGWPDMTGYEFHWYVLARDVLAVRHIRDDDVTIRSYQLLSRTLRAGATVADLISALDSPPVPPMELCQSQWERFRYGDLKVEAESIVA